MHIYYPKQQSRAMPWKNGQGETRELLLEPSGSSLDHLDFDYRLSMATIKSSGDFSRFPGYRRILLPVSGAGFALNGHPYATYEIAHFDGDEAMHCTLLKKEVTDLGLIYQPDKIKANARILTLPFTVNLTLEPDHRYLVTLLDGTLAANGQAMTAGDTLALQQESRLELVCSRRATLAFFTLQPVG